MNPYSKHPENPEATKAYQQVAKGQREKAIATLEAAGYKDAENQVEMIEGFIQFQENWSEQPKRKKDVKRLVEAY